MTRMTFYFSLVAIGFVTGVLVRQKNHDEEIQSQIRLTENLEQYLYDAHCKKIPTNLKYKGLDVSHVIFKKGKK